jgi:hypothetical protein
MTPADIDTLLRQAIGGDAEAIARIADLARSSDDAALLTAAFVLDPTTPDLLARATTSATTTRDRQVVAVCAAHASGDRDRVDALARDHLVDYPDSPLVAWIAAACPSVSRPPTVLAAPPNLKEQS